MSLDVLANARVLTQLGRAALEDAILLAVNTQYAAAVAGEGRVRSVNWTVFAAHVGAGAGGCPTGVDAVSAHRFSVDLEAFAPAMHGPDAAWLATLDTGALGPAALGAAVMQTPTAVANGFGGVAVRVVRNLSIVPWAPAAETFGSVVSEVAASVLSPRQKATCTCHTVQNAMRECN